MDGSCLRDRHGRILGLGWAFILKAESGHTVKRTGTVDRALWPYQNVAAEITAVVMALLECRRLGLTEVTIHYDYTGLEHWITGQWRAKTPLAQAYVQTVRSSGIQIHWHKIKAHGDDAGNALVDLMAKSAATA